MKTINKGLWVCTLLNLFVLGAHIAFASDSSNNTAANRYTAFLDLTQVKNDRLPVVLTVPTVSQETIEYHIPKIVPGTYSISDFGRFLHDFTALDTGGQVLPVEKLTDNRWKINNATTLKQITYWVEDSYDTDKSNVIFEPAGTNIEEGKNFVLNTFGFVGYLEGMKHMGFDLKVKRPENFYGATALPQRGTEAGNIDVFEAPNYFDLADGPLMYCVPDTATFMLGNTEVLVSVYSPNKVMSADFVRGEVKTTLQAQAEYLGGTLPVDKYAFLIYLLDRQPLSGGMGALEHSYSSVYSLPEARPEALAQTVRDVAAHEFFHIVTPLNIHSEEIGDFDFINPKMSQHLWMYEGLTEYAAGHAQVKGGIMPLEEYLTIVQQKMETATEVYKDDLPFTELSKKCLGEHEDQYGNVYEKGALIGMCLDLTLRDLSGGSYGTQNLMADLAKAYGKEKSFKDDELFQVIIDLTYPEVGTFIERHIAGPEPLPFEELLGKAGITYAAERETLVTSLGKVAITGNNETQRIRITDVSQANAFGKAIGYQQGDEILSINGELITYENAQEFLQTWPNYTKKKVKMVLARPNDSGGYDEVKAKAKTLRVPSVQYHVLEVNPNATPQQLALRKAWLNL